MNYKSPARIWEKRDQNKSKSVLGHLDSKSKKYKDAIAALQLPLLF